MLDLTNGERLIPLSQVPGLPFVPRRRRGRKLHAATVFRWASRGVKGVRLDTAQFGGTKVTTATALQDFFARLSRVASPTEAAGAPCGANTAVRVGEELDAAGI